MSNNHTNMFSGPLKEIFPSSLITSISLTCNLTLAFFEGAGSTNPKASVRSDEYHECGHQTFCVNSDFLCQAFASSSAQNACNIFQTSQACHDHEQ